MNQDLTRAQLGLLSRFIHAEPFDGGGYGRVWAHLLGEPVEAVTARFRSAGLIEVAPAEVQLAASFGAAELKEKAKAAGIRFGGTKAAIAERMAKALDPSQIPIRFGTCTALGRRLAESYLEQERQRREGAATQARAAIEAGDLRKAAEIGAAWDIGQLFPSGLGMETFTVADRAKLVLRRLERAQQALITPPAALASLTHPQLTWLVGCFQRSAALNDDSTRSLELREAVPLDGMTALQAMPVLNAWVANQNNLADLRASGVVRAVQILPPGDCALAQGLAKHSYSFDECPEIPVAECRRGYGCACCYSAVIDQD
jgi:hypothetical protein